MTKKDESAKMGATYTDLQQQLDAVVAGLGNDNTDIDEAIKLYEQGTNLVAELKTRLQTAENTITKLAPTVAQDDTSDKPQ